MVRAMVVQYGLYQRIDYICHLNSSGGQIDLKTVNVHGGHLK